MFDVFSIGICHSKSSAYERSKYALTIEQQIRLYNLILPTKYASCFILNTCNRTEIYGIGKVDKVIEAYKEVLGEQDNIPQSINRKTGRDAIGHIIKVACGLDSQVIGDLEILGQFKSAFNFSKQNNVSNGYMERLVNTAIQAAKETRSKTKISSGTVSLSYAAIKYIKRQVQTHNINILVVGTGDFGKRIANNIKDYLPNATLTLSNRTASKAEELALKLHCKTKPFKNLSEAIAENDVIISSVNDAKNYLINEKNTHSCCVI